MIEPYFTAPGITVYHGDAADIVPTLVPVSLLLIDPPYGIGEAKNNNASRGKLAVAKDYGIADWDDAPVPMTLMNACIDKAQYSIVFGGNYYPLPPSRCWFVWNKLNGNNDFADAELAWSDLPSAVRLINYRWNGMIQQDMKHKETRVHPTQKPTEVMRWCIQQAQKKMVVASVLDAFMGSGTTLLAALSMGIPAIGIERERKYCDAFIGRYQSSAFREGQSLF